MTHKKISVISWEKEFNYSAINNYGVTFASGEYYLFLNNDIEIITPDWLQEMLMFAQRSDVGCVGAKLFYPDGTIQHAGLGIGLFSLAGHLHRTFSSTHTGYMGRLSYAQNISAVTGACMMIPKNVFHQIQGFDEAFQVALNDVDICMRIRKAGYLIIFTPFAELYHYEYTSRGLDDTPSKVLRFKREQRLFQERWKQELLEGDPYYNPNLTLAKEDLSYSKKF